MISPVRKTNISMPAYLYKVASPMVLALLKSNVKLFEFLKYICIIGMYIISMSFIYEFILFIYKYYTEVQEDIAKVYAVGNN